MDFHYLLKTIQINIQKKKENLSSIRRDKKVAIFGGQKGKESIA